MTTFRPSVMSNCTTGLALNQIQMHLHQTNVGLQLTYMLFLYQKFNVTKFNY